MEVDLPVWTIRPNWKQGVLERLEWMTAVMTSDTGVEQRTALRRSPRRSFEITVNPTRNDRTFLDLMLHRLGSEEWLFPLWHDQAKIDSFAENGQAALSFDNTFREFTDGGYAILYFDTFKWEVVQIDSQDAEGAVLTEPLAADWPVGTKLYPIRRCTIQTDTSLKALTSRAGESVLLFEVNEPNDWPEMAGDAMLSYLGSPLLTLEPNRSQEITTDHTRFYDEADGGTGLRYRTDSAGRAFSVQSHNWMLEGREAQAGFRSFLHTLRGRQRMVWLPTFNDDVILARPVADGANNVSIEQIGLAYVGAGAPIPGRARLWTGKEVVLHAGFSAALGPGEERLALTAPTTEAYPSGASWAFLDAFRLNQDQVELHHHTDSDGVLECAATFQAFSNNRDGAGSNFLPIPESEFIAGGCGQAVGLNPCAHVPFNGVYLAVYVSPGHDSCNECWSGNRTVVINNHRPNGPLGKQVGTFEDDGGGCVPYVNELYELDAPFTDARLNGQLLWRFTSTTFNVWKMEFFFPSAAYDSVTIFPAARYCGSVGKDEGFAVVTYQYAGQPPVNLGEKGIAGNGPNTW